MNPNQAYKDREFKGGKGMMMTEPQRAAIERLLKKNNTTLVQVTTHVFGYKRQTKTLTHTDAARCILALGVWKNIKQLREEL